jgi:hypothetical protein
MPNKLKKPLKQTEFYCVSCRKRVKSKPSDICAKTFKNGTPALVSHCEKCDTNLTKFIKHNSLKKMEKKYGKC